MPFRDFAQYPNKYFIETGSYLGDGIQAALDSGFTEVVSIEISPKYYEHCKMRFLRDRRVTLVHGDSTQELSRILTEINEPITFYLDGHWSMEDTGKGEEPFPLLEELAIISQHPIKTHTLIIDDVRLFEEQWNIQHWRVRFILKNINTNYTFEYKDGYVKDDVLIARVK